MAQRHYLGIIEPGADNWSISFPAFPGVISVGGTFAEVLEHGRDALASVVDAMQEDGQALPLDYTVNAEPGYDPADYRDPRVVVLSVKVASKALRINVIMEKALLARPVLGCGRSADAFGSVQRGGRRLPTGCADRAEADCVLTRYASDLDAPQLAAQTTEGILGAYLVDRQDRGAPGAARLAYAHLPLVRHMGLRPSEALTEPVLKAYTASRLKDGVAASTARTELQALRAALTWAVGRNLIAAAPKVPPPLRPPGRDRWLTREEADRMVAACADHHLRLFVLVALNTAGGSAAILALTWSRVDIEGRRLDLRTDGQSAAKKAPRVPINDTLLSALIEARAGATSDYVIEWGGVQRSPM